MGLAHGVGAPSDSAGVVPYRPHKDFYLIGIAFTQDLFAKPYRVGLIGLKAIINSADPFKRT